MKVISVNVGLPREVVWKGALVTTGIFKDPVEGPVKVNTLNLTGDAQADLTVHGGPQKAVYGYASEHDEYWKNELPGVSFPWGKFGENLTTDGLHEEMLHIGDKYRVGSALLMVTQPRLPCYKLTIKFDRDDMIKRFLKSGRTGIYFSVIEQGEVEAGSKIELVSRDPAQVKVSDITRLYLGQSSDPEIFHRAIGLEALPKSWRDWLQERVSAREQ
jgi:MOSC domain-containing protein YiiM